MGRPSAIAASFPLATGMALLTVLAGGCSGQPLSSVDAAPPTALNAPAITEGTPNDWYGDHATTLVHLDQGWNDEQRKWFYTASQGSELMPYAMFVALEQADDLALFHEAANMRRFRWLTDYAGSQKNAGLPLGFVRHGDAIGLTCSACHTTQINYRSTGIRIDGGTAMADFQSFLEALQKSLDTTLKNPEKFARFSTRVLGASADNGAVDKLRTELKALVARRALADAANGRDTRYGFARVDAFGRIYNRALRLVDPNNGNPANAPVSYPVLWDTPQHDWVQWSGFAANVGTGALQRNVGQIVGVFGHVEVTPDDPRGYSSSVDLPALLYMEREISKLRSPQWPAEVLPPLDDTKVAQGKQLYQQQCARCHALIDRADPNRRVVAQMHRVDAIGTDPTAANNIVGHAGSSGIIAGKPERFSSGPPLAAQALGFQVVSNLIAGVLQRAASDGMASDIVALQKAGEGKATARQGNLRHEKGNPLAALLAYKARPLNGVWASAPYLHNGSVPTLYHMLLPPAQRPRQFWVGRREFDAKHVGINIAPFEGGFAYDTTAAGNSNAGHLFGTKLSNAKRWALVEYLKSL